MDSVFFMGFEDGHLLKKKALTQVYDEERRIAYVGITRAKNFLFLTVYRHKGEQIDRSPFLEEMFGPASTSSRKKEKKKVAATEPWGNTHENPIFKRIMNLQRKVQILLA